jgi:D-serine deaminase-like pyridoxal phosphate-dependent protein
MTFPLPEGVTTPALVVDVEVVDRNIALMAAAARTHGYALRPHAKTHKTLELAARQMGAGARGLTVATVGEAEVFAKAGVGDVFIAYPLWADAAKGDRLRRLAERVRLTVGVDSAAGARRLAAATARGAGVAVLIEVDSGHHRTGVVPSDAGAVAAAAAGEGLAVTGVFTFPGHGYAPGAPQAAARDEERALAEAADGLRAAGLPASVVSGGSTPTVAAWRPGAVNELRPGVYVFNDAQQLALGSCGPADVALAAAATVVSVPAPDRMVLDAGSKTLGADRPEWMPGYGHLPDYPDARVASLSEHHAVVRLAAGTRPPALGALVGVVPNHACNAVNLADELLVARAGEIIDRWPVAARGANF